jgi:hypothetical protein
MTATLTDSTQIIMNFSELKFQETVSPNGVQALVFFPNGYGASVVKSDFSYGGKEGLYELAVIEGDEDVWMITYESSVTSDVLGYLTEEDVERYLKQIEQIV